MMQHIQNHVRAVVESWCVYLGLLDYGQPVIREGCVFISREWHGVRV